MFISLKDLELKPIRFSVELAPGEITFDRQITQTTALRAEGKAEMLHASLGEMRIQGKLTVKMEAPCDRCLEPAAVAVDREFDLTYAPVAQGQPGGETEVEEAGVEVGFYEGSGLELNDVLREVVLLDLPMQTVCREDCQGICPSCGGNRNVRMCDCHAERVDDRWNQLKKFRVEFSPGN